MMNEFDNTFNTLLEMYRNNYFYFSIEYYLVYSGNMLRYTGIILFGTLAVRILAGILVGILVYKPLVFWYISLWYSGI